jgi:hypothetical protein
LKNQKQKKSDIKFPCIGCGLCCKKINVVVSNAGDVPEGHPLFFPHKYDETGRCEMLLEDNSCSIYEDRPLLCNVERFVEYVIMGKKEFYNLNIDSCNMLMDQAGLDINLRIKHIK